MSTFKESLPAVQLTPNKIYTTDYHWTSMTWFHEIQPIVLLKLEFDFFFSLCFACIKDAKCKKKFYLLCSYFSDQIRLSVAIAVLKRVVNFFTLISLVVNMRGSSCKLYMSSQRKHDRIIECLESGYISRGRVKNRENRLANPIKASMYQGWTNSDSDEVCEEDAPSAIHKNTLRNCWK